jgi:hypothetical protein
MVLSSRVGWSRLDCEALPIDEFWDAWDTLVAWEAKAKRSIPQ